MHITCNAQKSSKHDRGKTQQWKTTEREIYWTDFQRESKPKHPKLHYDIDIFKIHAQHKAQIKKKKKIKKIEMEIAEQQWLWRLLMKTRRKRYSVGQYWSSTDIQHLNAFKYSELSVVNLSCAFKP